MTDEEMATWLMGQNDAAGDSLVVERPPYTAAMLDSEAAIGVWLEYHPELEPILAASALTPWVQEWFDGQTQRPAVLSYADFNTWAQVEKGLIFTKDQGLIAYAEVITRCLTNTFELMRIIKADEWQGFFDQYGGVGVIAGVVDQSSYESAPKDWRGMPKDPESVRVVYYFSEAQEAAFARIAF